MVTAIAAVTLPIPPAKDVPAPVEQSPPTQKVFLMRSVRFLDHSSKWL
jgi:hypothetical protein